MIERVERGVAQRAVLPRGEIGGELHAEVVGIDMEDAARELIAGLQTVERLGIL